MLNQLTIKICCHLFDFTFAFTFLITYVISVKLHPNLEESS